MTVAMAGTRITFLWIFLIFCVAERLKNLANFDLELNFGRSPFC